MMVTFDTMIPFYRSKIEYCSIDQNIARSIRLNTLIDVKLNSTLISIFDLIDRSIFDYRVAVIQIGGGNRSIAGVNANVI